MCYLQKVQSPVRTVSGSKWHWQTQPWNSIAKQRTPYLTERVKHGERARSSRVCNWTDKPKLMRVWVYYFVKIKSSPDLYKVFIKYPCSYLIFQIPTSKWRATRPLSDRKRAREGIRRLPKFIVLETFNFFFTSMKIRPIKINLVIIFIVIAQKS